MSLFAVLLFGLQYRDHRLPGALLHPRGGRSKGEHMIYDVLH
jgi:hypothetical protein